MKSSGVKRSTHRCKKGIALLMAAALMAGQGVSLSSITSEAAPGVALKDKYTGFDGIEIDWKYGSSDEASTYGDYAEKHGNVPNASQPIEVPITGIRSEQGKLKTVEYEGRTAGFSEKAVE